MRIEFTPVGNDVLVKLPMPDDGVLEISASAIDGIMTSPGMPPGTCTVITKGGAGFAVLVSPKQLRTVLACVYAHDKRTGHGYAEV